MKIHIHHHSQGSVLLVTLLIPVSALLSPEVKQRFLQKMPNVFIVDGFGSSETGAQGTMMDTAGQPGSAALTLNLLGCFFAFSAISMLGFSGIQRTGH